MQNIPTLLSLSEPRKSLVLVIEAMRFGRIDRLHVQDGEPVIVRGVTAAVVVGRLGIPHAKPRAQGDFSLSVQMMDLMDTIGRIGDGMIECIKIHDGQPTIIEVDITAMLKVAPAA